MLSPSITGVVRYLPHSNSSGNVPLSNTWAIIIFALIILGYIIIKKNKRIRKFLRIS